MLKFEINGLQDSSVLMLNDMQDRILINPDYQREGGIWTTEKQQLFIDSLLNRYDVPKIYFHRLSGKFSDGEHDYSIIDGRQRLEAIWAFLNNEFPLSDRFEFFEDGTSELGGKYFREFSSANARMVTRLYSRALNVVVVHTNDVDWIEDMFLRLNEAVPLNAAEKRNAFGGPLPIVTRKLVAHKFFTERVSVSATRYRHHDIAAKLIWLNLTTGEDGMIADTKKATLDDFYRRNKKSPASKFDQNVGDVRLVLDDMVSVFSDKDVLLKSTGTIPVYFLLYQQLREDEVAGSVTRRDLRKFEEKKMANRRRFQASDGERLTANSRRLLEYDELTQSSNDAASIETRLNTLRRELGLAERTYLS